MSSSYKIRDIVAEKGTKRMGSIVIQDDDVATVKLTVGIVNGSEEGPVLCVTGGMMGTHYPGINACIRVFNDLDPKKLRGTLIVIPVLEFTGFQKGIDRSSMDGLSLNSVFPGDPDSTITKRIAFVVFNEVIKRCKYHLDLRGGDLIENILFFIYSFETGDKNHDEVTMSLIRALGTEYYVNFPDGRGALVGEANKFGINSIALIGSRGLGTCEEEDIQRCLTGTNNLLKHLKMVDGNPETFIDPKQLEYEIKRIRAKHGGLLYLNCACGDIVKEGQMLGQIRNLKGEVLQELYSPADGVLDFTHPQHIQQPGNSVFGVRRVLG